MVQGISTVGKMTKENVLSPKPDSTRVLCCHSGHLQLLYLYVKMRGEGTGAKLNSFSVLYFELVTSKRLQFYCLMVGTILDNTF